MSAGTAIEWTHRPGTVPATWNPTTGCDRISAGCDLCYALVMAKRLKAMGSAKYQNDGDPRTSGPGFGLTVHADTVTEPFAWRKPRTVFVNSMSDLFHARVPSEFLAQVFAVMSQTPQHTYQILTKRPERMARILVDSGFLEMVGKAIDGLCEDPDDQVVGDGYPFSNVWLGTSIELDKHTGRADALRATPAAVRFISAEPLLGPLPELCLDGIDCLILGGESGHGARALDLGWLRELVDMARAAGTAIFVKQLGSVWAKPIRDLVPVDGHWSSKGGDWDYWPDDLRIREFPTAVAA